MTRDTACTDISHHAGMNRDQTGLQTLDSECMVCPFDIASSRP